MSRFCDVFDGMKPTILMVVNQIAAAGVNVFYKLACNDGMKVSVLVAYRYMFGSIAVIPLALYFDRNKRPKLTWKVIFQGIMGSGFVVIVMMYCVRKRGPLFVSVFSPLVLVMVAIAGSLFLDESLHLGSVIGALVIIVGLYVVLWGQSKEMKKVARPAPSLAERFSGDHHRESAEMIINICESEREVNSCCNMVALGVIPSFLPSTSPVAPDDDGEHYSEDQGLSMEAKNHVIVT